MIFNTNNKKKRLALINHKKIIAWLLSFLKILYVLTQNYYYSPDDDSCFIETNIR